MTTEVSLEIRMTLAEICTGKMSSIPVVFVLSAGDWNSFLLFFLVLWHSSSRSFPSISQTSSTQPGRYAFLPLAFIHLVFFPQHYLSLLLQSYAGKYVPAISYYIHKNNPSAKVKINLVGMAIGDGLCDPETVCTSPDAVSWRPSLSFT